MADPLGQVQSELQSLGLTPYTYEDVTVSTSTSAPSSLTAANLAFPVTFLALVADGGTIRFTRNATAPGPGYGLILLNQGVIQMTNEEGLNLQMVTTSTACTAHVEYFKRFGT